MTPLRDRLPGVDSHALVATLVALAATLVALAARPALAADAAAGHGRGRSRPSFEPVERKDVSASFQAAACAQDAVGLPLKAWSAGIYDAQIDGRIVQTRDGLPVDHDVLLRKARALARVRRFRGYAAGACDDKSAWIVALPSSKPLRRGERQRVELPVAELAAACESWRVDFAAAKGGAPTTVHADPAGGAALAGLGDGVLSVTCQPRSPRWQGPVLWFLAPVGRGPATEVPELSVLGGADLTHDQIELALGNWANRVRVRSGLKPVAFTKEMSEEASLLTIDSGLVHNRTLLKRIATGLEERKIRLLGENRVKGQDLAVMAWLLWNSPRHRDLILQKDAKIGGIARREVRGETLTVMIFGDEAAQATAKAAAHKPAKVQR